MAHFSPGPGKPMHERSNLEIWLAFVLAPLVMSAVLWVIMVRHALAHAATFTAGDWLQLVVCGTLFGVLVPLSLPAVAYQELRKRAQAENQQPPSPSKPQP